MYDLKTILLAKRIRRELDVTRLSVADIALLEIIKNASDSNPVRDATITNGIATFNGVVASSPLVSLKLNIPVTQTGSGTPSPTNIRDFVGVTGAVISRTGKNLFDNIYPDIGTLVKYRQIKVGNGTFTMSSNCPLNSDNAANIFFFGGYVTSGGSTALNGVYNGRSRTFETTDGYVTVGYRMSVALSPVDYNSQIELSSVATAYEPYTGNTYQITFGQTVYSAILDVLRGKLTIPRKYIVYDGSSDEDWAYNSNYNFFNVTVSDYYKELGATTYNCNEFNPIPQTNGYNAFSQKPDESVAFITTNINKLMVKHTSSADLTEFKQFLSEHNMKLVYELAEPIEIDLTPTQITTLIGENVIFADVADVTECKYTRK